MLNTMLFGGKPLGNAEIQRAIRVSSDQPTKERSLCTVKQLFMANGYPLDIIQRTIKNNPEKDMYRHHKDKKDKNTNKIFMRLPYIDENIVRRVNGILRGSKAPIKPVWINYNSLQNKLISSPLTRPPCPSGNKRCHTCDNGLQGRCNIKNVVYKITCKQCEGDQRNECYVVSALALLVTGLTNIWAMLACAGQIRPSETTPCKYIQTCPILSWTNHSASKFLIEVKIAQMWR